MLELNAATYKALGEARLFPDEDLLFIAQQTWMLAFPFAKNFFSEEILQLVEKNTNTRYRQYVDWRVLTAKKILNNEFIPARGRKLRAVSGYPEGSIDADRIHELFSRHASSIFGDTFSLREAYASGEMKTVYEERPLKGATSNVAEYIYNNGVRAIAVSGPMFDVFYNSGFDLRLPVDHTGSTPPIGLFKETEAGPIYGFFAGSMINEKLVRTSPDGRKIYANAAVVSWFDISNLLKERGDMFGAARKFYEPGVYDEEKSLDEMLEQTTSDVSSWVSALRWHGVPEDDIVQMVREGAAIGRRNNYAAYLVEAMNLLNKVQSLTDRALSAGSTSEGWFTWQRDALSKEVEILCGKADKLPDAFHEDISMQDFEELVNATNYMNDL